MNLLDLIFPKKCLECGKEGKYICHDCLEKVRKVGWTQKGNIKVYSVWKYEGVIRKAIIALKYKYAKELAKELTDGAIKILKNDLKLGPAVLVPVPMYKSKERFRGFNQTEILGEQIASKLGFEYLPNLLTKTISTKSQTELRGEERKKNLTNAFKVNKNFKIKPKEMFVIFDDVLTTGSTVLEMSKVLKQRDCKNVSGLTICAN